MKSAEDPAVHIAAKTGSVITIVMDMNNICIPLIIQSSASDSQLVCPWLECCLDSACLVIFDVRTLPPADSPLYDSDSLDKWVTADMWPGVTWTPQNNLPQLWQVFIFVLFILTPQTWLFVFFYLQLYCWFLCLKRVWCLPQIWLSN